MSYISSSDEEITWAVGSTLAAQAWHAWGPGLDPQRISKGEARLLLSGKDPERMPEHLEQIAEMLNGEGRHRQPLGTEFSGGSAGARASDFPVVSLLCLSSLVTVCHFINCMRK